MSEHLFERVAIIGLGQMGASLAMSIKAGSRIGHIVGFDLHSDHSSTALSMRAIDTLAASAEEAVENADLIALCTPVGAYSPITKAIAPYIKEGAVFTDIGSIKSQAIKDITTHLPQHVRYVPSHPIAGSERVGPYTARGDYFVDHLFLITPHEDRHPEAVEAIGQLWQSTGARIDTMPANIHDHIYAYMSHMPQLMAFAAMPTLDIHAMRLDGGDAQFQRFIRIGRSDPEMWRDVLIENSANSLSAADSVYAILHHIRNELAKGIKDQEPKKPAGLTMKRLLKSAWPRILASALITAVNLAEQRSDRKLARYAAGGFTDFTSPATEAPEGDMELVSEYGHMMVDLLDTYLDMHVRIVDYLRDGDGTHLLAQLAVCQACGKRVIGVTA